MAVYQGPENGNQGTQQDSGADNQSSTTEPISLEKVMTGGTQTEPNTVNVEGKETDSGKAETTLPTWTSQLPDELKNNKDVMAQLAKFQKIGDVAKSYAELEKKLGTSVSVPGKDAAADEINSFWEKVGKPKDAESYSVQGEEAKAFRDIAFAANLTDSQATAVFEALHKTGTEYMQAQEAARQKAYAETESALKEEYGAKFPEKMGLLAKGLNAYGGAEVQKVLTETGLAYNPAIVKMLIKMGETVTEAGVPYAATGGRQDSYVPVSQGGQFKFIGV